MKYKLFILAVPLFLLAACDKIPGLLNPAKPAQAKKEAPAPAVKGTVIARVNNMPVTLEELNSYITIYNASIDVRQDLTADQKKEAKIETREKKIEYLKAMLIRQAVFYQAALDRGLDRKEAIKDILERYRVAILAQDMQNEIVKNLDVSSAEVEDAYKNNKNLFREPESRKVREIVVRTEDEAKQALLEILQGGDFSAIAKGRSTVESAKNGGDLGFIQKGQRGEKFVNFDEMVFSVALDKGAVSSIFKVPDGYSIVKIEEIKEGKLVTLSEAWDTIKQLLLAKKQQEEIEKSFSNMSRNTKIEILEGEIK